MAPVGQFFVGHVGECTLLQEFIGHVSRGNWKHEILATMHNVNRQLFTLVQIKHADDHAGRRNWGNARKQLGAA